jgi:cytochrome c-type biogenesis protein CcmH
MKIVLLVLSAATVSAAAPLSGPALEREAREIETLLIAPCCWNQQVSEHQSAVVEEVKKDIREQLAAGRSRQEILDAFVARYGKKILAEPPAQGFGLLVYVVPLVVFAVSGIGLTAFIKRMSGRPAAEPATAASAGAGAPAAREAEYARQLDDELRDMD